MRPNLSTIPERERVETPKRMRLTPREVAAMMLAQGGLCGCSCGRKLEVGIIVQEHVIPLAIGGVSKPDSLWHKDCSAEKTKGDIKTSAKVRRLRRETGRNKLGAKVKKIRSAGFSKTLSRKFDGTVRPRGLQD